MAKKRSPKVNALQALIATRRADNPDRYSYSAIANRGGISRSTVYAVAMRPAKQKRPTVATLQGLADGLEVPLDRVLEAASDAAGYSTLTAEEMTLDDRDRREIDALVVSLDKLSPEDRVRVRRIIQGFVDND